MSFRRANQSSKEQYDARYLTLASAASRREKLEFDVAIFEKCGGKIEKVPPSYLVAEIISKSGGVKS